MHDKPWNTIEALDALVAWFKANFPGDDTVTNRANWINAFEATVKIDVSGNY